VNLKSKYSGLSEGCYREYILNYMSARFAYKVKRAEKDDRLLCYGLLLKGDGLDYNNCFCFNY
jgi:hypothetical protein